MISIPVVEILLFSEISHLNEEGQSPRAQLTQAAAEEPTDLTVLSRKRLFIVRLQRSLFLKVFESVIISRFRWKID
ncbi:hypothetical protein ACFL1G_05465 [Planctomycetota bacterium]